MRYSGTDGGEIDSSSMPHFSLDLRLVELESELFYETDKGKIQANGEILARELRAGRQARSLIPRHVCSADAGLRLVGYPGSMIRADH